MDRFTEREAADALDASGSIDLVLTWEQTISMLPLVRHIINDYCESQHNLLTLQLEKSLLDLRKAQLQWPERSRRYQLEEDVARQQKHIQSTLTELEKLGVVLVDGVSGLVGFPTIVNNRVAFFSWKRGEAEVRYWHFATHRGRRLIPEHWKGTELVRPLKKRRRKRSRKNRKKSKD